jgi:hypothetical protein
MFLWRYYADLDDVSQEALWGFSPHGKLAEQLWSNVYGAVWAADPPAPATSDVSAAHGRMIKLMRPE